MGNVIGHDFDLRVRQNKPDLRQLVYKRQNDTSPDTIRRILR